jgi:hypothetical protein
MDTKQPTEACVRGKNSWLNLRRYPGIWKSWEVSAAVTVLAFSLFYIPWVAICEWSEGLFTKYHWSDYITNKCT